MLKNLKQLGSAFFRPTRSSSPSNPVPLLTWVCKSPPLQEFPISNFSFILLALFFLSASVCFACFFGGGFVGPLKMGHILSKVTKGKTEVRFCASATNRCPKGSNSVLFARTRATKCYGLYCVVAKLVNLLTLLARWFFCCAVMCKLHFFFTKVRLISGRQPGYLLRKSGPPDANFSCQWRPGDH